MRILIIILLLTCAITAQTSSFSQDVPGRAGFDTIAGDLPAALLAKERPYYVAGDIYVPHGKTVVISAGAVLCFKNFTGLHVQGTLLAKGEKDRPVVFTSENDKTYNKKSAVDAAPYDWNGIYIHEDAIGSQLSFCAVLYSVDGINSLTKFFKLSPCLFMNNGRASLTILGTQYQVTSEPYEYSATVTDAATVGVPITVLKDPLAPTRTTLRYSGAVAAAFGAVVAVVAAAQLSSSQRGFSSLSSTGKDNLAQNSGAAWEAARLAKNNDLANLCASLGIAAVGTVGIFWSFRF